MKLLIVTILLAIGLFSLMIILDLIMGINPYVMIKEGNPFRVMEKAEYLIIFLFILYYFFDIIGGYLKEKQKSNPPKS